MSIQPLSLPSSYQINLWVTKIKNFDPKIAVAFIYIYIFMVLSLFEFRNNQVYPGQWRHKYHSL